MKVNKIRIKLKKGKKKLIMSLRKQTLTAQIEFSIRLSILMRTLEHLSKFKSSMIFGIIQKNKWQMLQ